MDDELNILRAKVKELNYPDTMIRKCNELMGTSFFPAGIGGVLNERSISERPIMVLGQDQDNLNGFEKSKGKDDEHGMGNEAYSRTWQNIEKLFKQSDIPLKDCFFTNAIMGLRANDPKNTGKSPAFQHNDFIQECIDLLAVQIQLQRPRTIVCLGFWPLRMLSCLSSRMQRSLVSIETYADLDKNGYGTFNNVSFDDTNGVKADVITLLHPSYRHANLKNRAALKNGNNDPEVLLLKQALKEG